MSGGKIHADFGGIEQLSSDQGATAGQVEDLRSTLLGHVSRALSQLDGGMGTDEHQACMRKADELINQHINDLHTFRRSTNNVNETFQSHGQAARNILAAGS